MTVEMVGEQVEIQNETGKLRITTTDLGELIGRLIDVEWELTIRQGVVSL